MHKLPNCVRELTSILVGRRLFLASATLGLLPASRAKADLFGGDVAILLAQFEQQLRMVSHAIETVQNLVRTVEELQQVVSNGKTLLQHAGDNGLTGLLDAARGGTNLLRGVVGDLRRINTDIGWWQRQLAQSKTLSNHDAASLARQKQEWNVKTLESASTALDAYQSVDSSYDDLRESKDIVLAAQSTPGVVGQMQLLGRQNYYTQKSLLQLASTQARGMQVLTNAEAGRSFDEERRRKNTEDMLKDWDAPGAPTDVSWELPNP